MSYLDRTFCPPELTDKPDCAECVCRFDEHKCKSWCALHKTTTEVSFATNRLCEPREIEAENVIKPNGERVFLPSPIIKPFFLKKVFGAETEAKDER